MREESGWFREILMMIQTDLFFERSFGIVAVSKVVHPKAINAKQKKGMPKGYKLPSGQKEIGHDWQRRIEKILHKSRTHMTRGLEIHTP
jgi:hypothetical protein